MIFQRISGNKYFTKERFEQQIYFCNRAEAIVEMEKEESIIIVLNQSTESTKMRGMLAPEW